MTIVDKIEDKLHIGHQKSKSAATTPAPTHGGHTGASHSSSEETSNRATASNANPTATTAENTGLGHTTGGGPQTRPARDDVAGGAGDPTRSGDTTRSGDDTYDRRHQAPVVKETVRDEYQHNVQPVIQKEHDKTDVIRTVQPLKDSAVHDTQVHTKQRDDQFQETGQDERLARETEEKLRLHREELAKKGGREHLEDTHRFTENAPQVGHTERRHVIEEVQPVVEKDVLRPHVVQEQQNVFVHEKEAPQLRDVRVAPTMKVHDWEKTQAAQGEDVQGRGGLYGAHDRNHDGIPDNLQHGRDRDHDSIPDKLEHGRDRNHDGIPDKLEHGRDRDHNGIPDKYEHGADRNLGGVPGGHQHGRDRDHDGIPDKFEHGRNRNHEGIPDKFEHGRDRDHDGVPDKYEQGRDRQGFV